MSSRLTADQALARLIAGGDLMIQRAGEQVLVLRPRGAVFPAAAARGAGGLADPDPAFGADAALAAEPAAA